MRSIAVARLYRYPRLLQLVRHLRPSGSHTDHDSYARHLYQAFGPHCTGGTTLEIGPGASLGTSALLARDGCRAFAMDLVDLRSPEQKSALSAIDLNHAEVPYLLGNIEAMPFADQSFDFVFSNSCLEHVPDPARALSEIARILRPGGRTAHQIDFRDHWHMEDPLRFLQYGDRLWRLMNRPGPGYQNRWRLSKYLEVFEGMGFDFEVEVNLVATDDQLRRAKRPRQALRDMTHDDLVTLSARVVAHRRVT